MAYIRRALVVLPVVIGEPGIFLRDCDQIAGALVVDSCRALFLGAEDAIDSGRVFQQGTDVFLNEWIVDVDVCDLMIGDGKGLAGAEVEEFSTEFLFDREPALVAEDAIEVDRSVDVRLLTMASISPRSREIAGFLGPRRWRL